MKYQTYIRDFKSLYEDLLSFIDDNECNDAFPTISQKISDMGIKSDKIELEHFLRIVVSISNNHHRTNNFFNKIEQILELLETQIKQTFSKSELFCIFGSNKKLLLYIFKDEIASVSSFIEIYSNKTTTDFQNRHFFIPELKNSNDERIFESYTNYEELRQKGENDSLICSLIRDDSIVDFVTFVTRHNISLSGEIKPSIFETNRFLNENKHTLIEYAAFFGSIQIVKFLKMNGVELKPSLWRFAIHSNNPEMINVLEECGIKPPNNSYMECYKEAIKCHHNNIAQYFSNELELNENDEVKIFHYGLQCCNCLYYPTDLNFDENSQINYVEIVNHLPIDSYDYYLMIKKAADNNDVDFVYYLLLRQNEITRNIFNKMKDCIIPPTIKTIGYNCFIYNDSLTTILIPQSVTTITMSAFKGCKSLKEIIIPSSVTKIRYKAFCGCKSLKKFEFPSSVTSVGGALFNGCVLLTEINFPSTITKYGMFCFRYCKRLETIKIPSIVDELEKQCFLECRKLSQVIFEAPSSIEFISAYSFFHCTSLRHINIPSSVTLIEKKAFWICSSLEEITIPSSVTSIEESAFYGCTSLKEIIFSSSLGFIGASAFEQCTSLKKVIFDKAAPIKEILDNTFKECSSLDFLILPASLKYIGERSFKCCYSLNVVYIPPLVHLINRFAFYLCHNLRNIVFESPSSLEIIRLCAFAGCYSLDQIWLPHSLKIIEKRAFGRCSSLKVAIPNGLKDIRWGAFEGCNKCWRY